MITFLQLGRLGRLGNQLFQYAALRGLSLKKGYQCKIPDPNTKLWHGQRCLLGNFQIQRQYLSRNDVVKGVYVQPDYMKFDSNFFNVPDGFSIHGFFQSTLYFKQFRQQIKHQLTPKPEFIQVAREKIRKVKQDNPGYQIVSLHIRRGDQVDNSNPSKLLNIAFGEDGNLCDGSFYGRYFNKAKAVFNGRKVKFLIFTGGSRSRGNTNQRDIQWCKRNIRGQQYVYSQGNDSMVDFRLITQCDHNIMSHTSTFSWWAAYVNSKKDRIVVAPLHYHSDMPQFTYRQGFYPQEYMLL